LLTYIGNVNGSSMARWKACGRHLKFLLVLSEHYSLVHTVEALYADIGLNRGVRKGGGQYEHKFQEELVIAQLFHLAPFSR